MRSVFLIIAIYIYTVETCSQLVIPAYPMEITCEAGFTAELEPPAAYSNCDDLNVSIEASEELVSGGGCAGKLIITYYYTDPCENTATAQVIVTLKDTQEPEFYDYPADIRLRRGELVPFADKLEAYDNSMQYISVKFSEQQEEDVIIRTWIATDVCGNSVTHTQKIFLPY